QLCLFSSRRRHTRSKRDWSSDVCCSDLVVRQTISKWEQGLSVPDSDLLIALSEALDTPVSTLLGETVVESEADTVKALSEKLEKIGRASCRERARVEEGA